MAVKPSTISSGEKKSVNLGSSFKSSPTSAPKSKTKEQRTAEADEAGLTGDFRDQYINSSRKNTYRDTFWDKLAKVFGGKLGSEKFQESLDLEDQAFINELLNAQREQEYNSEPEQAARLRAAGVNPDLDGGASLSPAEASQIDDEVLGGTGLASALSGVQSQPMQVASALLDGCGSLLSLVSSGVGISRDLFSLESSELQDLFAFAKGANDLGGFLPMFGIDPSDTTGYSFEDEDGNLVLYSRDLTDKVKSKIAQKINSYKHPRTRKLLKSLSDYAFSDKALQSYFDTQVGISQSHVKYADSFMQESARGLNGGPDITPTGVVSSYGFNRTMDIAVDLYQAQLKADKATAEYRRDYNEALAKRSDDGSTPSAAELQAAKDRYDAAVAVVQDELQSTVYDSMTSWLSDLSSSESVSDRLLLLSVMSGGFKQLGFDSPFELPLELVDKVNDVIGNITDFIPVKGVGKAFSKSVSKSVPKTKTSDLYPTIRFGGK